jgi:hypothetical protein
VGPVLSLHLPACCEPVGYRRVLLPELALEWADYPRGRLDQQNVDHLVRVLRSGRPWATPLVVDEELRLIDGWHRVEALKEYYGDRWVRLEVDVFVVRCRPADRLLAAALMNRRHGLRLDDTDAARVAALWVLRDAPESPGTLLRRVCAELAVGVELARMALREMQRGTVQRRRQLRRLPSPPPVAVYDPRELTVDWARGALEAIDQMLMVRARDLLADPACTDLLRRIHVRLGYLFRAEEVA